MKKKVLALLLALTCVVCACGSSPEEGSASGEPLASPILEETEAPDASTPAQLPEKTETEETSDDTIKIIGERVEKDGKIQSYLTGEWKSTEVANRRPMAVMIPNNKAAQPQYGISMASVVVEAPMEAGTCTRLMGIFEDYDELDHIGPVRSSRLYFIYEAMSFDAIYCNWGLAVPYVADTINSDRVDNISAAVSGIEKPSDEAFSRDEVRKAAGYATEYTGIMTIDGYESAVARQGYETTYRDTFVQDFLFAEDGYRAEYNDFPDIYKLSPGGDGNEASGYGEGNPYFVYNPETKLYTRYQFGSVQYDDYNNEDLTYSNVIFKIVYGEELDDKGYLSFIVHGEGVGYVFTNGKIVPMTWRRSQADNECDHYYAPNGDEIVLNQGKTWICLVWQRYQDLIAVE